MAGLAALPLLLGGLADYGLGTDTARLALLALGLQVTFGLSGQLHVGAAPVAAMGAYVAASVTTHGGSWLLALPLGGLAAAAVGALVGLPAVRVRGDVLALATLAAGELLDGVYLDTRPFFGAYDGISGVPPAGVGGHVLADAGLYAVAAVLVGGSLLLVHRLAAGPVGRAWRADRDDALAAAAAGIPGRALRVAAFGVGSALGGLSGVLYAAQEQFVSSSGFTLTQSVDALLVALLAGEGRLCRTVTFAAGLTLLADRLRGFGSMSEAVTGALVLLAVVTRRRLLRLPLDRLRARWTAKTA